LSKRAHFTDYDEETTARCERALVTLIGDLGPWRERIYLVGGLAPKYLVGRVPPGSRAHVGTTDVDLVIGLALGDDAPETYRTLKNNLEKSGFRQSQPSFRWSREVDDLTILVEFLCETNQVEPGRIYQPKGEATGSGFSAFNVRGAHLVRDDFVEIDIEGDRLDNGGHSRITMRMANLLPYVALKIFAFQDRHENKDSYDLVFTLLNYPGGPRAAGKVAASSSIVSNPQVTDAMALLAERFADIAQDGPTAYAAFLATADDTEEAARLRQEAVATIREFLTGLSTSA
jgi:hypothetical protein